MDSRADFCSVSAATLIFALFFAAALFSSVSPGLLFSPSLSICGVELSSSKHTYNDISLYVHI